MRDKLLLEKYQNQQNIVLGTGYPTLMPYPKNKKKLQNKPNSAYCQNGYC
jgi:hypothetical protein